MDSLFTLSGKTILITGASSGIGRATAVLCAKMGATVILVARDEERLNQVRSMLEGSNHICKIVDFADYDSVESLVESLPIVDGVVNSAGINNKYLIKFVEVKMDNMFKVNCFSPALLIKHLLKKKKLAKGSSIVFLSSISSTYATISNALYAASKGAINSLTRVLALELSSMKIRVNSIQPGMVNT